LIARFLRTEIPKFTCRCGYVINLSVDGAGAEWTLLPETTIDDIGSALCDENPPSEEQFYDLIIKEGVTAYRCPACGRLHLEEAGRNKFVTYMREPSG
jgi:hypothetical protein